MRFELEDHAEFSLIEQQRARDNWVTTFDHVRSHEALGLRLPGEAYRPSSRRPRSILTATNLQGVSNIVAAQYRVTTP